MSELKRFIAWCIENDLAFTHIDEAVRAFRGETKSIRFTQEPTIGVCHQCERSTSGKCWRHG